VLAQLYIGRCTRRRAGLPPSFAALGLCLALSTWSLTASAQARDRSGKEVVDTACASCHASGDKGAPKIGDNAAWSKRASQGLTALTDHAIKGLREMPAHGGSTGVSDVEIERAITYMVNQSGGHWIEPVGGATPASVRKSQQIVQAQCAKCHESGQDGAPRIGDQAAWIPRLKKGLDPLVASAVHGHGAMPARGGMPDLTDQDIRGAIVYMFNFGLQIPPPAAPVTVAPDPYHKVVAGADVYLGMRSAEALRAAQAEGKGEGTMMAGMPKGKGYYYVNISLADSKTNAPITDAVVSLKVADAAATETRTLGLIAANNTVSYGNYFRMNSGGSYVLTAQIKRPGQPAPAEVRFEVKAR
jgi:cytochrome c5